jgi:hypothetical protein
MTYNSHSFFGGRWLGFSNSEHLDRFHLEENVANAVKRITSDIDADTPLSENELRAAVNYITDEVYSIRGVTPEMRREFRRLDSIANLSPRGKEKLMDLRYKMFVANTSMGGAAKRTEKVLTYPGLTDKVRGVLQFYTSLYDEEALEPMAYRRMFTVLENKQRVVLNPADISSQNVYSNDVSDVEKKNYELFNSCVEVDSKILDSHYIAFGIGIDGRSFNLGLHSDAIIHIADGAKLAEKRKEYVKSDGRFQCDYPKYDSNSLYLIASAQGYTLNMGGFFDTLLKNKWPLPIKKSEPFAMGRDDFGLSIDKGKLMFLADEKPCFLSFVEYGKD